MLPLRQAGLGRLFGCRRQHNHNQRVASGNRSIEKVLKKNKSKSRATATLLAQLQHFTLGMPSTETLVNLP
jgi:hypothetical protein